jgi:hypothetical protein
MLNCIETFFSFLSDKYHECKHYYSNATDIFYIGLITVSPITARSEPARRFDNRKEKSREILDWLSNKGVIA